MNVKILVCYHKKDILYKSNILVPIHCGRAVATEKHKDGQISAADYDWLLRNTIGDDTGDNISKLNREVNEMTAIYWAWKNYDKLGNPDFIGLCHYRRLFNFADTTKNPLMRQEFPYLFGNTKWCVKKLLQKNQCVLTTPDDCETGSVLQCVCMAFDKMLNLSEKYHPRLYAAQTSNQREHLFYGKNMFIMSRDDFFDYCNEIFPIMFDILNNENRGDLFIKSLTGYTEGLSTWLPRLTGYVMEYVSSLYFLYLAHNRKTAVVDFQMMPAYSSVARWLLSVDNRKVHGKKYKVLILFGFIFKLHEVTK